MNKTSFLLMLLSLFFIGSAMQSCTTPPPKAEWENTYFPLEELVTEQIEKLNNTSSVQVEKHIAYDGKQESMADDIGNWKEELDVYINADINKPVLKGAYSVEEHTEGNEKRVVYTANKEDLEVKRMEVVYAGEQPQRIEIEQGTKNILYETQRILRLELRDNRITNYHVEETQKLLFRDQVNYQLSAQVLYE